MKTLQDYAAEDAAYHKQAQDAKQAKEQTPEPPKGMQLFMVDWPKGQPVPDSHLRAVIHAADRVYPIKGGPRYRDVRDNVVMFSSYRRPGALGDAIARLCIPLLGYARVQDHVHEAAQNAQLWADSGEKPETVRFADVHVLAQHTERYFLDALREVHPGAHVAYIHYVAGMIDFDGFARRMNEQNVLKEDAVTLIAAASALKHGNLAVRSAISSGATSTDSLMPRPTREKMQELADQIGGLHLTSAPPSSEPEPTKS